MKVIVLICTLGIAFGCIAQPAGSLVVVNKADHTVSLIDLKQGKTMATIPVGYGPHEVAISPSGNTAAVTNYGDGAKVSNSLTIISIPEKKKISSIDLGDYQRPHGAEFINEKEVLITCESKSRLLLVDVTTGNVAEVANTAQMGSHMVAYSSADKTAYVANVFSGTVSVIDVPGRKLSTVINFKAGIEGLAVSPDGKELWVANRNDSNVTVVNTVNREILAVLPAHQVAFRVKFLANEAHVLVSNGMSGNVSVYEVKTRKWLRDIDVASNAGQPVPVGLTVDANGRYAYVCLAGYNEVAELNTTDWSVSRRIGTGNEPDGIYFSPVSIN
ncbi:MAG: beta-propeller fold lactonase family protein [Chitinophagaceae bacterium]